ncbi:GNAT family N-acetyltransferase [Snodgrassella gandavensis]|uniref:GNAT family N-acetyltransferase n=1 Tax=Snodgrassella gandavensis TaxID=2946698 RepID=UPI001EF69BAC|nr:GNAT family N-acetyltransferase [Snodgrassella gandavensis]
MFQETKNIRIVKQLNKKSFLKDNIKIKFASTSDEFFEAMWLIHREYVCKGLIISEQKQPYFSLYLIIPNNRLLIALDGERIIGTISLIKDSPIGVPMDNVHMNETVFLRKKGVKFAEIGSFAIDSEYQHQGIALLLYKAIFSYICQYKNIEYILAAVHPRVAKIYKNLFKFEQVGEIQEYSTLNNAQSVPLQLNTANTIEFIKRTNAFDKDNYAHHIEDLLNNKHFHSNNTDSDFSYIPIWQESHIQKYFNQCCVDVKNLPEQQRAIITWLYPTLN